MKTIPVNHCLWTASISLNVTIKVMMLQVPPKGQISAPLTSVHSFYWMGPLKLLVIFIKDCSKSQQYSSHTEQTFKNGAPFILLLLFSPPLCSSDTNTVFKGQCIQITHYSLFTQCKFLSQDLKDELPLAVTFPSQILVDFFWSHIQLCQLFIPASSSQHSSSAF